MLLRHNWVRLVHSGRVKSFRGRLFGDSASLLARSETGMIYSNERTFNEKCIYIWGMAVEGAWGHFFLWRSSVQDVGCWADASSRQKSESLGRFPGELELVVAPPHCHIRSLGFLRAGLVLRFSCIWVKISLRWFQASADALFHDTDYSKSECFRRCSSDNRSELKYSIFHGKKIEKGNLKMHSLVYIHVRNTGAEHMVEVS